MSQGAHHLEFLLKICNGFFLYEEKGVKSVQRGRVGGIGKALAEAPGGVCQGAGGQLHCLEAGRYWPFSREMPQRSPHQKP